MKSIAAASGNRCAFPNCVNHLFDLISTSFLGEVAHIKADNPGGPRFDPQQPEAERQNYDNLLLMCRDHHKLVDDNPGLYTVEHLREMKAGHEAGHHQAQVLILSPDALAGVVEPAGQDGELFEREIEELRQEAGGVRRGDGAEEAIEDGYLLAVMHPARHLRDRFTRSELHAAAEAASRRLLGRPFLLYDRNGVQTVNVRDGLRTLMQHTGQVDSIDFWRLRCSGVLLLKALLQEDALGAREQKSGRRLLDPLLLIVRMTEAIDTLVHLYGALGLRDEAVSLRLILTETHERQFQNVESHRAVWRFGDHVAEEPQIEVQLTRPLKEWAENIPELAADLFQEVAELFQWNYSDRSTLVSQARRVLDGTLR